jgi:hypothetical protein
LEDTRATNEKSKSAKGATRSATEMELLVVWLRMKDRAPLARIPKNKDYQSLGKAGTSG